MENTSNLRESIARLFGTRMHRDDQQTIIALRWLAIVSLFLFLAQLAIAFLLADYIRALTISLGIIPILVALFLIQKGMISPPAALLAVNLVVLVTYLAADGNGIYDIAVTAYPVIIIVAGLIFRERFISYLSVFIAMCLGWLVFGATQGLYLPEYPQNTRVDDFFYSLIIVLVAGNVVYLLVKNVHLSLERAEKEIDARKQAETERETLIRELKAKNQELNRFAITVSHDLKTPLITLTGYLGYLERDAKSGNFERLERDIAQINDAAKKMGTLVDQLLDLSRIGRIINPPTDVPFGEIVQTALKLSEGPIQARQVRVEVDAGFPIVHVDRVRILQVIQNLVTNSIKFMGKQADPFIEIGMRKDSTGSVFFVRDNGMGIAPEDQSGIFELFSKLDTNSEGNGIGLALVRRIIEVHGGKIWVESAPGKGATFFFTLAEQDFKESA